MRRAVAHGRGASGARRAGNRARRPALRATGACSCPRTTPPRRRSWTRWRCTASHRSVGSPTCSTAAGCPSAPWRRHAQAAEPGDAAGPRRRPRAGGRQAGARDRGGGGPQPAHDRPAGRGQDDARASPVRGAAAAELRGGAGGDAGAQRGRPRWRAARHRAPVPRAAPHDLGAGAGRRRQPARCRARSRLPIAACCSWTSCRSSAARRWTRCASRSRTGASRSCAASARWTSPPTRWSWPRATAARARGRRTGARARPESCARYLRRLSGPLLDRIDLVCQVEQAAPLELVRARGRGGRTRAVRKRVMAARARQQSRLAGTGALCNGDMDGRLTRREVPLDEPLTARMLDARHRLNLSGRGHDRVLRVARTIADLDGREALDRERPRRGALVPRSTELGPDWPHERLRPLPAPRPAGRHARRPHRRAARSADHPRGGPAGAARARAHRRGRRPAGANAVLEALAERDLDADRLAFARGGRRGRVPALARPTRRCSRTSPTRRRCCSRPGGPGRSPVLQDEPAVAIVGTRNPSPYGREVAHSLGRGLGAAGVPVVSGLALGIDATAHRGCLAGGGLPVAVLACGPDVVYPRRHRGAAPRGTRAWRRPLRAAARDAAVSLELPGAQPDHGRPGAHDGGGGGRRSERQPDHQRLRPRPGPLGRSRPGPRDVAGRARYERPAARRRHTRHRPGRRARRAVRCRRARDACRRRSRRRRRSPTIPLLRRVLAAAEHHQLGGRDRGRRRGSASRRPGPRSGGWSRRATSCAASWAAGSVRSGAVRPGAAYPGEP